MIRSAIQFPVIVDISPLSSCLLQIHLFHVFIIPSGIVPVLYMFCVPYEEKQYPSVIACWRVKQILLNVTV